MPKDDFVYVGHMLDKAQEVLALAHAKTRQDYDHDTALRLALTHCPHRWSWGQAEFLSFSHSLCSSA